jgi:hypothetical protein
MSHAPQVRLTGYSDPRGVLLDFLETTYRAGAELGRCKPALASERRARASSVARRASTTGRRAVRSPHGFRARA